jgi:hypothetical protein
MPKCPNCGRETQRTADWACQWCGQPLLSDAFKKIPQTYRELQEERALMPRAAPEKEPEPVAEPEPQPKLEPEVSPPPEPAVEAKAEAEVEKEPTPPPEPEAETVASSEPAEATEPVTIEEPETKAEPAPEPVTMEEPKPEPVTMEEPEATAEPEPATMAEPETEPVTVEEPEEVAEVEPEIATKPAPQPVAVPSLEPDPTTGIISATAEELNAAFDADKAGTNNRLANKLLKVTGTVDKIFAKDNLDIFYIILAGAGKPANWQIRCTFSREQGMYLSRLTEGQSAIVQGTYAGYERNIILKDCTLLQ